MSKVCKQRGDDVLYNNRMSGSVIRASNWAQNSEDLYLAAPPSGEVVALYQINKNSLSEDDNIVKIRERSGFPNVQCMQYSSAKVGLTAIGQLDGSCLLFDIKDDSFSPITIKPHQARSCNAVSFNENGLVVLGYDRSRQDHSIQVHDIEYINNSDLGGSTKAVHNYIQNESISSLSFFPTEHRNFVAGSYKLLREFDVRTTQPIYQLATRCTMNITVDPFNPYIFASNSEDGSFSIWDRRKLQDVAAFNKAQQQSTSVLSEGPVLFFNKLFNDFQRRSNGSPFRFSNINRGEISALFDGELVRRWKLGTVPASTSDFGSTDDIISFNKTEAQNSLNRSSKIGDSLFVSNVSDVKTKYERVISFDYAPSFKSLRGINFVCMRQSGSIYKMSVVETQKAINFNSNNDLTFTGPFGTLTKFVDIIEIEPDSNKLESLSKKLTNSKLEETPLQKVEGSYIEDGDREDIEFYGNDFESARLTLTAILENDICTTMRRRATLGYGANSKKNMEVLSSSQTFETQSLLTNAWKWVNILNDLITAGKMHYGTFDFGYLGVLGIWNIEREYCNFRMSNEAKDITAKEILNAAKRIVERRSKEVTLSQHVYSKGNKEIQRKMAMYVIGWDFGASELEVKYTNLVKGGFIERAVGWAIFHNDINRAVKILADSDNERYRIMATAIAAYSAFEDNDMNSAWKEQCRELGGELENPYLRATFAYIADGNWWDVLDESALPLRERLGVALRYLPDNDLNLFLNRLADLVIERGEIEGILLTGITSKGVDLLQSYVDRTSDVQSASLIASFASPRYFVDERVTSWVQSYRDMLNSWSLFTVRARFDVARARLSKTIDGKQKIKPNPRQLHLQCTNCHKSISGERPPTASSIPNAKKKRSSACPNCGFPLPRCAICLLTQGDPVPENQLVIDKFYQLEKSSGNSNAEMNTTVKQFKQWFSYCLTCNHCMHVGHAEEWFSKHFVCPVPDCDCKCNNI